MEIKKKEISMHQQRQLQPFGHRNLVASFYDIQKIKIQEWIFIIHSISIKFMAWFLFKYSNKLFPNNNSFTKHRIH